MRLSRSQLRVLENCAEFRDGTGWSDLSGRGIMRTTIRALLDLGAIEAKSPGFPGQLFAQQYRLTSIGQAALADRPKRKI
jgi:hypothetical protein